MTAHSQGPPPTHYCGPLQRQVIGKYELGAALAAGDFDCRTRLCSHVVTGAPYVVRIYDKAVLEEAKWMWNRVRASIYVQRTLPKHENIVEMVECFETTSSLYILMQLFQSVNVTKLLCSDIIDDGGAEAGDGAVPPSTFSTHWSDAVNRANQIRSGAVPSSRNLRPGWPSMNSSADALVTLDDHSSSGRLANLSDGQSRSANALPRHFPQRRARLTIQQVCNYFTQVVRGILHMHDHHVVHLGVAPDHILINDKGLVKIGNLVSCCFCTPGTKMDEMKGTRHTVAPEVLSSDPFDPYLADAWSLGVLLYFMLNGRYPHDGANTLEHIMYHHLREPDPHLPASAKDLIHCLLQPDPSRRLPVSEILQHHFFSEDSLAEDNGDRETTNGSGSGNKIQKTEEQSARIIQKAFRRYTLRKGSESSAQPPAEEKKRNSRQTLSASGTVIPSNALSPVYGSFHELLIRHVKTQDSDAGKTADHTPRQVRLSQVAAAYNAPMEMLDTVSDTKGTYISEYAHNSPIEAPGDYMPCPVCRRPPQASRNISTTPYGCTRYSYVRGGRFVLSTYEDAYNS